MEKVLTNYRHYLKNWRFIFICILPVIALFVTFYVIFELLFHQDFYLSNLISAIILFLIFTNVKDKFNIKG
ncbi:MULTISPECIES: hypothetical protein [Bacillus]|uniref:Uncharacterized protein n=5 Tax=Bacillus cereus group TaxID=86661 RepID=A0A9W5QUM7_BACCE|nr:MULTISPECIES: hypothetical protein [Bacillus cereus group]EJP90761.1 hypothetical protein IC1_02381 [Bacillus cereus VD022]EJR06556.1 hypothetical protein II5_02379 [Bacillus cereus MSX-A1]EOP88659.1 hypothetical protein IGM_03036 [Bacillus cereus HuB4-4]EOQ63334.1 hypothetical protein IAY_03458 [Bacillus cereus TIAC219]KAA0828209.1 hypothetical protein DN403_09450 [Bacillus sp. AY2-1]